MKRERVLRYFLHILCKIIQQLSFCSLRNKERTFSRKVQAKPHEKSKHRARAHFLLCNFGSLCSSSSAALRHCIDRSLVTCTACSSKSSYAEVISMIANAIRSNCLCLCNGELVTI
ncbi:hypothetical protein T4B_12074 [Trichinella pseudospiralis]|uniref:Uncharacterized protein n=1 Tax=Trichinella pseudospiralis TaxID=6337 RepID=A0A0V1J2U1_TRIPS|nr:hypothetical protein T4B_12074 [Trichinella pseudospiralis]